MEGPLTRRRLFGLFAVAPVGVALVSAASDDGAKAKAYEQALTLVQAMSPNVALMAAQDVINRRRSHALHLLNTRGVKARG